MLSLLIAKFRLIFKPPKEGDMFCGNPFEFIYGSYIERVMHGLKDDKGNTVWEIIPSDDCYRITVVSAAMPSYYRFTASVLCKSALDGKSEWRKRNSFLRITKKNFHEMIVDGRIKKYELI